MKEEAYEAFKRVDKQGFHPQIKFKRNDDGYANIYVELVGEEESEVRGWYMHQQLDKLYGTSDSSLSVRNPELAKRITKFNESMKANGFVHTPEIGWDCGWEWNFDNPDISYMHNKHTERERNKYC